MLGLLHLMERIQRETIPLNISGTCSKGYHKLFRVKPTSPFLLPNTLYKKSASSMFQLLDSINFNPLKYNLNKLYIYTFYNQLETESPLKSTQ
jgi:hypothetical protein